jgi:hypothetical protein
MKTHKHKTFGEVVIHEPRGVTFHESDSLKQAVRSLMTGWAGLQVFEIPPVEHCEE